MLLEPGRASWTVMSRSAAAAATLGRQLSPGLVRQHEGALAENLQTPDEGKEERRRSWRRRNTLKQP